MAVTKKWSGVNETPVRRLDDATGAEADMELAVRLIDKASALGSAGSHGDAPEVGAREQVGTALGNKPSRSPRSGVPTTRWSWV